MDPQTAAGLLEVIKDRSKLKEYAHNEIVDKPEGFNNEEFIMDLPYEGIKGYVEYQKETVLSKLSTEERATVQWEHVGSTSVKGMPGTMMPDALLFIPEFPPSQAVVQALLDSGYYFRFPVWLRNRLISAGLELVLNHAEYSVVPLHLMLRIFGLFRILNMDFSRDMCRSESWAFEDYKNSKIEASKAKSFIGYKMAKGSGSKLLAQLREKHGMGEMNIKKDFDGKV